MKKYQAYYSTEMRSKIARDNDAHTLHKNDN